MWQESNGHQLRLSQLLPGEHLWTLEQIIINLPKPQLSHPQNGITGSGPIEHYVSFQCKKKKTDSVTNWKARIGLFQLSRFK